MWITTVALNFSVFKNHGVLIKALDSTPNDSDSITLGPGSESYSLVGIPGDSDVDNVD